MEPKKRKGDVRRIDLKTVELNKRGFDLAKRQGALVEREKDLAKRDDMAAATTEGEIKQSFSA